MQALSEEQRSSLALFREVTADNRDEQSSIQVLRSCNWNVEQALQLHWATDNDAPPSTASTTGGSGLTAGAMAAPLLGFGASSGSSGSANPAHGATDPASTSHHEQGGLAYGFVSWITSGIKSIGAVVFNILRTFIFGAGVGPLTGGNTSGAAFTRALTSSYGSQLVLPKFHEGSFSQAVSAARRDLKLLVVYLHSEHARYSQSFCTEVLGNELIRAVLDENFIVWGGDVARREAHQVSQMIRVQQFPSFCVLLPASVEEIRVIGALHGEIQPDAVTALLTANLEEMETHRSEIVAKQVQHVEDRHLREQQDREYQEALEMDRRLEEQRREQEREEQEVRRQAEEQLRLEQEAIAKQEAQVQALQEKRQRSAASLLAPTSEAKARIALRLPTGQRVDRKFLTTDTLADVYAWADCVAYLPENAGKGIEIPQRFVLKTSFPVQELTEMDRTVDELKLSGSNILLAEIEDDDD
eukprot:TRINITY_DN3112_c0_g2_i1.p1 TRINITY_DN3112_c0_g2~~TRINITY_DN3112_c0_g2_i1.p1  ORF type:complete len:471 (+),score=103.74 TRINITY_DN3112_c0_g2_i1:106-1518(+)